MALEDFEELLINRFINVTSFGWQPPVLNADFGGGYGAGCIVAPYGTRRWRLDAEVLPDMDEFMIEYEVDGEDLELPRFSYFLDFFQRHLLLGNKPFKLTDPRTGDLFLVRFADSAVRQGIDFQQFTAKVLAGGVDLVEARAVGVYADFETGAVSNEGASFGPVTWTHKVNVLESPVGQLTKNGGVFSTVWDAGAFSNEGIVGDGAVRFTMDVGFTERIAIGLSVVDSDAADTSIDYAFYLPGGTDARIRQNGVAPVTNPSILAADGYVMEIRRTGTTVYFYANNALVYTSAIASTGTLRVDFSCSWTGYGIKGVELRNGPA